ncbi:unnamed protein product [Mytilus coruscus]|uniref:Uncharacterized protein n=1 Tax=Mytilus coruscus TaxID=42192 RepID=A0A6J8DXD1_MYTCO|nr:unnamed protein product [Mytilus coruscus]
MTTIITTTIVGLDKTVQLQTVETHTIMITVKENNGVPPFMGLDNLPEREVIDFKANSYGEIFCEFLSNVNCCVLNGCNHISNDYAYVSTQGSSVVDYCAALFENINSFKSFEVIRSIVLANKSSTTGSIEPNHIPDHSVLCWEWKVHYVKIFISKV